MTPRVSFIIASRNDNWCGDSLGRLRGTLRSVGDVFRDRPGVEIILVDWASADPLSRHITLRDHAPSSLVHVLIPKELTRRYEVEFCETVALNVAIRMSAAPLICRLDQDTMIGPRAGDFLWGHSPMAGAMSMFSTRRDLAMGQTNIDPSAPINSANLLCHPTDFCRAAIGVMAASRVNWDKLRGYDESLIHRLHMEHELCERMRNAGGLRDIGMDTNWDFYHQWHDRAAGDKRKWNKLEEQADLRKRLQGIISVNPENWGMRDDWDKLQTTRVDSSAATVRQAIPLVA